MNNKDLEYLHGTIDDYITRAIRQQIPIYTNFYNLAEQRQIEKMLEKSEDIKYIKNGGYGDAERCIFIIYSAFIDYEIFYDIPIKVLRIDWNEAHNKVRHRDVLGAILGLGIERHIVGDIIIKDGKAYAFVMEDMADYIIQNLLRVGVAPVNVDCLDTDEVDIKAPAPKLIRSIIASPRLDCMTGAGFRMSRTKSSALIKSGRVMLNWEPCTKPSEDIEPGDVITIRGKGRIRYKKLIRTTRKNKLSVEIERYV